MKSSSLFLSETSPSSVHPNQCVLICDCVWSPGCVTLSVCCKDTELKCWSQTQVQCLLQVAVCSLWEGRFGGGGHVRIMKLTPLWAGGPVRTGNNCSGSTAGCWWCGCSSGPGRAHRARRSGLSSGENRPGSGGVAAARLPSFLNDNKLGVPACNAGWERGGGIGEVCLSLVQVVSRRVPWQRERAFGGEIFLSV